MKLHPINMNDVFMVKFTEYGKKIFFKYHEDIGIPVNIVYKPDDKGFICLQLYELFNVFGPTCFIGNVDVAFEDNLIHRIEGK